MPSFRRRWRFGWQHSSVSAPPLFATSIFETLRMNRSFLPHARQARPVITKDSDFVALVERLGPPPQIVWLTIGNTSNAALRELFAKTWPAAAELLKNGEPLIEIGG